MHGCDVMLCLFFFSVVQSLEDAAESFVDRNNNFTNTTVPRRNLLFRGTRVSSLITSAGKSDYRRDFSWNESVFGNLTHA